MYKKKMHVSAFKKWRRPICKCLPDFKCYIYTVQIYAIVGSIGGPFITSPMLADFLKLSIPRSNLSDSVFCCELVWLTCPLLPRSLLLTCLLLPVRLRRHPNRLFLRSLPLTFAFSPASKDWRFPWSLSLRYWKVNLPLSKLLFRTLLWLSGLLTSGRGGSGSGMSRGDGIEGDGGLRMGSLLFMWYPRAGHAHAPWHPLLQ